MKQLLAEMLKQWWSSPLPDIKPREVDLVSYFDPKVKKIIAVTGFRRVGKTFTLLDFARKYGQDKCVYINFEDERIPKDTKVLTALVDLLSELKGRKPLVLLMDEIQEIPDWSLWARRVNEAGRYRLILSGSSSKLSSREIPTELRGQTVTIPIFPLNWNEFLRFQGVKLKLLPHAEMLGQLRQYLTFGGMPEIALANEGLRPLILSDYLASFVSRDIVERFNLRNSEAFSALLRLLPGTRTFTYSKLANSLKSAGFKVSKATVIRYLHWLEWSFFVAVLEMFSQSARGRIQTPKKAYLVDNYFSSYFSIALSQDVGHLMEQAVFHKLHAQSVRDPRFSLSYWKDYAGNEVDFVAAKNKKVVDLVQVTFADTYAGIPEREVKSLLKAAKALKVEAASLVTWDVAKRLDIGGISVSLVPLWQWLA
ncbi:MAG: ATP-binding protein [bacterium]